MIFKTRLLGHVRGFKSVKDILAKVNEEKSGDRLAGIVTENAEEWVAAEVAVANLALADLRANPAVPHEKDRVIRIIQDDVSEKVYEEIKNWTVTKLRKWLLDEKNGGDAIRRVSRGLTVEVVATVAKLMSNPDLIYAARKVRVTAHCNTIIGLPGTLSCRLQPNHPTDDPGGTMAPLLEGLIFGAGGAVLGPNLVGDSVESVRRVLDRLQKTKTRWDIPTQICVLAHVATQMEAVRQGAPCDLVFQSIADGQKGNEAFGLDDKLIEEARQLALRKNTATGPNVMYPGAGQGSELSSEAHHGADQMVIEVQCYGSVKRFQPFPVSTVVGFIGPEYLYNSKQAIRAGLEDHFTGKLTGIPVGCDACYINHVEADQNDIEGLAILLTAAGCSYFIGIPHDDDVMLDYQTTGFHETAVLRELHGLTTIPPFQVQLKKTDSMEGGELTELAGGVSALLA